jgi:hypothetical protein
MGSQLSKSSGSSLKNSSSSSISNLACCLYHFVKLTFWGDPAKDAGAEEPGSATEDDRCAYCSRKRDPKHPFKSSRWLLRETSSPQSARRPWYKIHGSSTVYSELEQVLDSRNSDFKTYVKPTCNKVNHQTSCSSH